MKCPSSPYYREFDLEDFGIETEAFLARIRPTFEALPADTDGRPRSVAYYDLVHQGNGEWGLTRGAHKPFEQLGVSDDRKKPRLFSEMSATVGEDRDFVRLLLAVAGLIKATRAEVTRLLMTAHQVSTIVRGSDPAYPAPEGLHHDGMDFVVPAMVISRDGIRGGSSIAYAGSLSQLTTLRPGQGILLDDRRFMHGVTPIRLSGSFGGQGRRDIIGLDIQVRNGGELFETPIVSGFESGE